MNIKLADHNRNICTYENFIAYCPYCGHKNIYNRRDDLKTVQPISNKKVTCFSIVCNNDFYINGDMLAEKYEYFIFEAQELIREKKYMHTITTLATSCESFFYHAVKVKLVYEPFKDKIFKDLDTMNKLFKLVDLNIKKYSFESMKKLFIYLYFSNIKFKNADEISSFTSGLSKFDMDGSLKEITKTMVSNRDIKMKILFYKVRNLNINELRNLVVHKKAYRPTSDEAQQVIDSVTNVLVSTKIKFNIQSEDNYINNNFRIRKIT